MTLTLADLEQGLRELGLGPGEAVEVHGALSQFGWVEGGAPTVVEALMRVVGEEGALVMSAYPLTLPLPLTDDDKARGIRAKVRFLAEGEVGRTGMGAIADAFRQRPGVVLGPGFHRVCAWGRNAEQHSQGYQYLLDLDGWVLLLGVDIHRCSSMHLAEAKVKLPPDITAVFETPADILCDYPADKWYIQYGEAPEDAWGKIQAEAERRGLIRHTQIGQAECRLFRAKAVVDLYAEALRTDPYGLYGLKPANPSPLIQKIDCVRLYVPDLEAGLAFYRDRLGHALIWRTEHAAGLRMLETDAEMVLQTQDAGQDIDFKVESAEAAARRFEEAGGEIVAPPFDIQIGRATVVRDPWGNRLVLLDVSKGLLVTDEDGQVLGNAPVG
jgi:aminoglycoside N3'-acetyltransferase/predicted enzyme related to lactoylglutathione lyase